jgi:ribosome-associated protein
MKSTTLPEPFRQRCIDANRTIITDEGILRLDAQVHRTQESNKELLQKKLSNLIKDAFKEAKVRKISETPKHVVDRRIAEKKKRSKIRASRTVIVSYRD